MVSYLKRENFEGKEFVVFDLETTGLFFEYFDEPIEIGAVKINTEGNLTWDKLHLYILPRKKITKKITEITGLTEDIIKEKGPTPRKEALLKLRDFIGDGIPVGHNVHFDVCFINYWFSYYKIPLITSYICTKETYQYNYSEKLRPAKGRFLANLAVMCETFGVTNKQAHSAIEDTVATAKCFIEMMNLGDDLVYTQMTQKEAYADFKARNLKSRVYKNVLMEMTVVSPYVMPEKIDDGKRESIMDGLDLYKTPREVAKDKGCSIHEVERVFVDWITPIKLKKMSHCLWYDKRTPVVIREILELCNWDLEEAYEFLKYLTPYPPDKFKFEVVRKLDGEFTYKVDDLDEYFENYQPIKSIIKNTTLDDSTVLRLLAEWLLKHEDCRELWIQALTPLYLLTKDEYKRMIDYKAQSQEKYEAWYKSLKKDNLLRIETTEDFIEKGLW